MERDAEQYIQQLEKRIVLLEGRVAMLESRLLYTPQPYYTPAYPPGVVWGNTQPTIMGCHVCGIGKDGKAYGYVCNRPDCPTRVTC